MNIKRIIIPLLLIILLASTIAFGSNIPLGPYFDDTYFDLSGSALILKVIVHEKGGLEADVSAYDGLILITGGNTSNLTIGIGDDNIVEMDDADAAVDDYCKLTANGIVGREYSEVKTDLSLNLVANLKVKLDGTQAPTVNNDVDEGYTVGSRWFDITNDKEYACLDNTDGAAVWTETTGAGGYTNLTSFVDQTAWRVFYSNTDGDVTELALGTDGQYLKSTGATSAPIFDTPGGAGDMLKATYDVDEDGDIDVAAGGTEKSAWTQYAIPYLSNTTVFGEIPIGTAEYALTVAAGATGYDWTEFQTPLTFGIADTNKVQINSADVADDDYAKFTETGLEGRSYAEMKTDLAYQLSDLSDVGVTTPTDKYVLVADGDSWESRALVEADISDLGTYLEDITGESIFDLSDVTADPGADKYPKWDDDPGQIIWVDASGYTNLTSFVDQTAWRVFYSNTDGDVTELALGTDGQYLKSTGATSAPIFDTPGGAGDMLKATYDSDEDGDVDVAAGGTEKSVWTLYAIPYLSGTTAFGEIPIGTAEYCLTVAAGATGYDWTELAFLADVVDDTSPELGGELDAGAHTIGFTLQTFTAVDDTTTIDWTLGNKFEFTFDDENQTFTFTPPTNPCNLMLWLIQDGVGSRTITWPVTCRWPGGVEATLSTAADAVDIVALAWNGTNYDCVASNAFAVP